MYKAYKYRIYPNKEQEILIAKTFGCCRFVYNQTLAYRKKLYEKEKKSMSKFDCYTYMVSVIKSQYDWLKEPDKFALANAVYNMDSAYQKFFKEHAGYPRFRSKHSAKKSYKTNITGINIEVSFKNNKIKLPKLKWVKAKIHRRFVGKIKSATVSQNPSGKYFVSLLVETEHVSYDKVDSCVGIDLGIKDLLITSNGTKIPNMRFTKKYENKFAREQRRLSRRNRGGSNYAKQRIKVARVYEKIRNTRIDYLHKISHKLIIENQVIVSEDLAVSNMVKNHKLAKAIVDCSWYELTRQLQYKAEWNERRYVKIDRYFPSSQTCSCCGCINKETKDLSIRKWTCPKCGIVHDRDTNAAINILHKGLEII